MKAHLSRCLSVAPLQLTAESLPNITFTAHGTVFTCNKETYQQFVTNPVMTLKNFILRQSVDEVTFRFP